MVSFRLVWEEGALDDRERAYEYLSEFNLEAAEHTDQLIEAAAESLLSQPLMGVVNSNGKGRRLVMTRVNFIIFYDVDDTTGCIRVMRVLHQSQRLPNA